MSNSGFAVPPGQYPPFFVVTDTDHTAWIVIATALGLSLVLLFGCIRIFIRRTISPGFGRDDATLAASTFFAVIQSSIVLGACSSGLGKSIELIPLAIQAKVQRMYYASNLFFVIALGLSKISVVFFLLRLTVADFHRRIFNAAAVLLALWTVGSTFAVALQCNLSHPWLIIGERCAGTLLRWQIISAFDIISEIGLVGMSLFLVWGLQTSVEKKVIVVVAFSLRLPLVATTALRLANFNKAGLTTNPTLLEDLFVVWTQTELNYSLISATIPSIRVFVFNLSTQFGGIGGDGHGYGIGSANLRSNASYQMSNLKSIDKSSAKEEHDPAHSTAHLTGQPNAYSYGIWVPSTGVDASNVISSSKRNTGKVDQSGENKINEDATSLDSNDSRRMIIRKDVAWEVEEHEVN